MLRLSGYVRTDRVGGNGAGACLWLRVDGPDPEALPFDNMPMSGGGVRGTTGWKKYEIVLDVAQNARRIGFGAFLRGSGKMWVDDLQVEVVESACSPD